MFIDINKIDEQGESLDRDLDLEDLDDGGGVTMPVTVARLTGRVYKAHESVEVAAHLDAGARRVCGRCLELFEVSVSTDFRLTLVAELPSARNASDDDASGGGELFHAPDGMADLRLMAAEQIYLAIPMKPLCTEDCKGLCPACGANRNLVGECGCGAESTDPRLAPLRELKDRLSQSRGGLQGEH